MRTIFGSRRAHYLAKVSIFLITAVLVAGMAGCDGDGGYNPPSAQNLEIRTWSDLDAVRNNLDGSYILMNDLDSTTAGYEELASRTANGGKGWQPIGQGCWVWTWFGVKEAGEIFKGSFDGQGHEIRDIFINSQEQQVGLFGFVAKGGIITEGGSIKNLTLINATVTTGEASGNPAGLSEDTVRCLDVAPVGGVGGLVGYNGGTVSNCHARGKVTGGSGVGGLVGDNEGTTSNCSFTGTVSANEDVGSLVGVNKGTVRNCYFVGNVTGNRRVGGLVGYHSGTVNNSYYNYEEVLINGENIITIGALFGEDFEEWLANDKFLDINNRIAQEGGYYLINDVSDFKQLLAFGQDNSLKLRLKNDLDLGDEPNFYIPYLAGEFDGNGHKISNLNFKPDFVSYVGLFGYLAPGGKVTQMGVENINIVGASLVGGLIGSNYYGTVSNCYATGSVTGDAGVGGLVGENTGTVSRSYSIGSVSANERVGGLVGKNYNGSVSNCYATGSVSGLGSAGGLVGWNWEGTVSNSYSTGSVTGGSGAGGLVGSNWATVRRSFWDIETSGQTISAGGTGKTTAQMKNIATLSGAGWNIIAVANPGTRKTFYIWNIVDGVTYPFLSWQ
jgi:hypothetical protein